MRDIYYFDNAASTPLDPQVVEVMLPYLRNAYGNPSSLHIAGRAAADAITEARSVVAKHLSCSEKEIYFTSGGTEGNNIILQGVARASNKKHIITTVIEHPSTINCLKALERQGYEVTYLSVNKLGQIDLDEFYRSIKQNTLMLTTTYGNSEIGSLPDLQKLSEICKENDMLLHLDACQSAAYLPLSVKELGCDLLTINGSKLYGPKGVGAIYVRSGIDIWPIMYGGAQQLSLRPGTENVASVVGLAKALEIAAQTHSKYVPEILEKRLDLEKFFTQLGATVVAINSPRLPNHLSVILPTEQTNLVHYFDKLGVCVSSGSACSSKSEVASTVLLALGLTNEQANKTIRITLSKYTTEKDIEALKKAATQLLS